MKIQPYVEKLNASEQYKEFHNKNHDAFLVAGFFVLDFETGMNVHQIDYYIPSQKKVAAFTLDSEVQVQILETAGEKTPERLDMKTNIDLDGIKGILEDEMKNRNITSEIKKVIAIIQNIEGKKVWSLNCILSGMEILKAHVDDESRTVLKMEKASVLDYIKKMPPQQLPEPTEEDIDAQIKELEKVKQAMENQKKEADSKESQAQKHQALMDEKRLNG